MTGSLQPLPKGHVGAIVTYLEMRERPKLPEIPNSPLRLEPRFPVGSAYYRALFLKVGGPWLWFSRLTMDGERLLASIGKLHVVLDGRGEEIGMLELDFREPRLCLIRFLGLIPEQAGKRHGRWFFAETLRLAWRRDVDSVRVNTCTLDHPAALPSYLKAGFRPYERAFESFPDPRLTGILPRSYASHVPILD